nr:hypothetical protein [Tanacetum cinerariifolium]
DRNNGRGNQDSRYRRCPSFSGRIVPLFDSMLVPQGEGLGTPTEPHHTPTPKATPSPQHELSSSSFPPIPTESLPSIIPSDNPSLKQYTMRTRIAQSSVFPPVEDEPVYPFRDDSQGEACPTDSGFEANQDRANIAKTSTLPSDSTSRVTSLAVDEGSMQQKLDELMALCTSLQRKQSEMISKFALQELEINSLKARIKLLEDKDKGVAEQSGDDAPIKGRKLDEGEEAADRVSDDTKDMATVLTSIDAAKYDTPKKKKLQEQIDVHVARELEEQIAREDQRMSKQIARDAEVARIHAEEEL